MQVTKTSLRFSYESLPPAVLCMLYLAFVMPLFDYRDVVWSPSTAKQTRLIEKIHSNGSLPPAVLCMLYSAFVMPLFDYCDVVWSPSTAKQTCLIEKFINKLPVTYHSKVPFTLTERRRFHMAIQIFKSLRQLSPPYLHDIFSLHNRSC